jgi:UDP-glucose 4-epimerase
MRIKGSKFKDMKVVVTGGAGFIGSHLVDRLVELGSKVFVIDNLSFGKEEYINKRALFYKVDVREYDKLKTIISDADIIYHLAAIATTRESAMGWKDPITDYEVNAIGTLNIFRAIVELDIDPLVVYTSSAAVYGKPRYLPIDEDHPTNPISPYGISKLAGEKYAQAYYQQYGIKQVILRIFNTYGPRQPRYVMLDLLRKLKENPSKLEVLGTGEQIRDYCYISDVIDALIMVIESHSTINEIYNIGSGIPLSIKSLVERILDILNLNGKTKVYFTGETWEGDIDKLVADISKAKEKLQFEQKVSLNEGLIELKKWFFNETKNEW